MDNRLLIASAIVSAAFLAAPAYAAEPFGPGTGNVTANIGLTNNYVFRGISQSDENFAIQGGIDYSHDSGIYLGTWASNVDFNDGDEASVEIDMYGGWKGEFNGVGVNVGGIFYWYPGAADGQDYDYMEAKVELSHDFEIFAVTGGVNFSPEYFGSSGTFWYPHASVDIPLPYELTLSGNVGYNSIDEEGSFGFPDYWDYGVKLSYNFYGVDLALAWTDTDLSGSECADGCDDNVVFSVVKSF